MVSHHVAWEPSSGGNIPPEAIAIGETCEGERLYMGRVLHDGTLTPGKVHCNNTIYY